MIHVINRPQDEERRSKIEPLLQWFDYCFIEPEPTRPVKKETSAWNERANSLRLTTIKLVEEAMEMDAPYLFIMEDDAVFNPDHLEEFYENFEKVKGGTWDFLHLNYSGGETFDVQSMHRFRRTLDGVFCCQAYLINKNVYPLYLKMLENEAPIDAVTKKIHFLRKKSYIYEPKIVFHPEGEYSTLRNKKVDY